MSAHHCLWVHAGREDGGSRVCSGVLSNRSRSNGHKLMHRKLHLNIRNSFFTMQVTEHWHRLTRKVLESPSREIFKNHLDTVLWHVLWDDLAWAGWTRCPPVVPSNHTHPSILILYMHSLACILKYFLLLWEILYFLNVKRKNKPFNTRKAWAALNYMASTSTHTVLLLNHKIPLLNFNTVASHLQN